MCRIIICNKKLSLLKKKSTLITNADATPIVKNSSGIDGGHIRVKVATVAVASGDDDGSVFRLVRLPSNAVIHKIDLLNDAIADGTDYDCGIYQTAANGGAVVLVNAYADAVSMASARVTPLDITHEAGGLAIENCYKKVYEAAGLTTDPQREYDLCLTGVAVGTAAGDITVKVYYAI
jgi:hypothetical protein